jgi:hypothetical protein
LSIETQHNQGLTARGDQKADVFCSTSFQANSCFLQISIPFAVAAIRLLLQFALGMALKQAFNSIIPSHKKKAHLRRLFLDNARIVLTYEPVKSCLGALPAYVPAGAHTP